MSESYRIVIDGRLEERFAAGAFSEMSQVEDGRFTVLRGRPVDQSQLVGIINYLHNLGIEINSFEAIDDR